MYIRRHTHAQDGKHERERTGRERVTDNCAGEQDEDGELEHARERERDDDKARELERAKVALAPERGEVEHERAEQELCAVAPGDVVQRDAPELAVAHELRAQAELEQVLGARRGKEHGQEARAEYECWL